MKLKLSVIPEKKVNDASHLADALEFNADALSLRHARQVDALDAVFVLHLVAGLVEPDVDGPARTREAP